jgi:arylsulfatase A-like enzyme
MNLTSRKKINSIILAACTLLLTFSCAAQKKAGKKNKSTASKNTGTTPVFTPQKYNILFIAVDDLKPDIGSFGFKETKTPNLDKLSAISTIFTNTQCQQAVCGPSRASLLTGVRPDKTQVWDLHTLIRDKNPNIVMLPQYFKQNGYQTIGMGKIFDPRSVDKQLDAVSWSVPYTKKYKLAPGYEDLAFETYQTASIKVMEKAGVKMGGGEEAKSEAKISTECLEVPDDAYNDGAMANYAVSQIKDLKNSSTPFFLAVGFKKPHLPFVAPKKYWDLYDRTKITVAAFQQKSENGPDIAYHNSGELRSFNDIIPQGETGKKGDLLKVPDDKQKELIHGYYACISYIDAQIGKLVDALKANGLDKNTIIVIWGDHGWHLGDHSLWAKHSNFEQAAHAPLIITIPGITNGKNYKQPAEFVDIYPTLCELTGLPVATYLDGKSLLPVFKNNDTKIKDFAISQYPRGGKGNGAREFMGYSLRNMQYRFTEWVGNQFTTAKPFNAADVKAVEMYDLINDPNETKNIAADPKMKKMVDEITKQLHGYYEQQYKTAGVVQ